MRRLARSTALLSLTGAITVATTLGLATPAVAAPVPVTFDCQARPPIGEPQQMSMSTAVEAAAPATVTAGAAFEVTVTTAPMTVPAEAAGFRVNRLTNLVLKAPVPQGATFQSASLTGGSNLGPGIPTVTQANNVVTVTVPGPLAGGSTIQLPVLHLTLTASGAAGTAIETKLAGTSYADPGLTFTANVQVIFPIDVPASCFPNPSPTLTSTTIQAPAAPKFR